MTIIIVKMLSEWHVGSGTGRNGEADRQVVRDRDGLPYIPAKTLTGILRDGAEKAAKALDQSDSRIEPNDVDAGGNGAWSAWVDYLFGSQPSRARETGRPPRPAALRIRPAYLAQPLREAVISEGIKAGLTGLRSATAIERGSGAVKPDTLRVIEYCRADLELRADVEFLQGTDPLEVPAAKVLLGLAQRLVTSLGGGRRHGAGRCRIRFDSLPSESDRAWAELAEQFKSHGPGPIPNQVSQAQPLQPQHVDSDAAEPKKLRRLGYLDLTIQEPVTVSEQVRGNNILTARSVPGTMLLALVLPAIDGDANAHLRSGDLVVTDANVRLGRGVSAVRSVKAPTCLRPEKRGDPLVLHNIMMGGSPRTSPRETWIDPNPDTREPDGQVRAGAVVVVEQAHAVIDDALQRPTSESGGLFVQEGIVAGTVLRAEVWAAENVRFEAERLPSRYSIGRSRKDDFGRVEVQYIPETSQTQPRTEMLQVEDPALVWFQSDALIRDSGGDFSTIPTDVIRALRRVFNCETLELADDVEGSAAILATRTIDSWSSAWGLPRPTLLAVAAGSVIRVSGLAAVSEDDLQTVLTCGLGDRRAEGFGRIAIDHPLLHEASLGLKMVETRGRASWSSSDAWTPNMERVRTSLRRERDLRTLILRAEIAAESSAPLKAQTMGQVRNLRIQIEAGTADLEDPEELVEALKLPHWERDLPPWARECRARARQHFWLAAIARVFSQSKDRREPAR